jgi:hypothetical protein
MDPRLLHLTAMTRVDDFRRAAASDRVAAIAARRVVVRPAKSTRYSVGLRLLRARAA